MNRLARAIGATAVVAGVLIVPTAVAQEKPRVIEETLVLKDPTVAGRGNWIVGGALEYWYVYNKYDLVDNAGNKVGSSTLSFTQPGGNIWVGYGDITFQATTRSGKGEYTASQSPFAYNGPQKQTDTEYTLRWLLRGLGSELFTPYLVGGYSLTTLETTYTLTAPPTATWVCGGAFIGKVLNQKTDYKAPLVGAGGIFSFSESFGMRTDMRLKFYSAEETGCNGRTTTKGTGTGFDMTMTGYYNITNSLNFQLGAKFNYLNAGEDVERWGRVGLFGMLGYTHRF